MDIDVLHDDIAARFRAIAAEPFADRAQLTLSELAYVMLALLSGSRRTRA